MKLTGNIFYSFSKVLISLFLFKSWFCWNEDNCKIIPQAAVFWYIDFRNVWNLPMKDFFQSFSFHKNIVLSCRGVKPFLETFFIIWRKSSCILRCFPSFFYLNLFCLFTQGFLFHFQTCVIAFILSCVL